MHALRSFSPVAGQNRLAMDQMCSIDGQRSNMETMPQAGPVIELND